MAGGAARRRLSLLSLLSLFALLCGVERVACAEHRNSTRLGRPTVNASRPRGAERAEKRDLPRDEKREEKREQKSALRGEKAAHRSGRISAAQATAAQVAGGPVYELADASSLALLLHVALLALEVLSLGALVLFPTLARGPADSSSSKAAAFKQATMVLVAVLALEGVANLLVPLPYMSVGLTIAIAVLFTINPVDGAAPMPGLHMGTVPPLCVAWLAAVGLMSPADLLRSLYGTPSLRPYHLVVMFLGSVYLCTALERSGFLHTAATKVVHRYGRSPWGLFWALGCFSACLTVLIPDDIVTMTLTPITIRMCQLLNLPEIPFLFSQFFAGNIWAVTLVTGNPTNVLLAEDMGDTFLSFAARMGVPGIAAGLTSFLLMYLTNRTKVDVAADGSAGALGEALGGDRSTPWASETSGATDDDDDGATSVRGGDASTDKDFTLQGIFCLLRVVIATLFCAFESLHGLPVYLVVLIMGGASLAVDFVSDAGFAVDTLRHMPWELFSFVTGFLVLAEAMSVSGISRALAAVFLPLASQRSVAFVSGFVTMLFCNLFETLPATLIVFKMIDSVPMWQPAAIAAAGARGMLYRDARRAALSAVIFGSNFGANTACIGSLGGLMMRRLAALQGVTVTNGMLLKQGIPVMIPTMCVACYVLMQSPNL